MVNPKKERKLRHFAVVSPTYEKYYGSYEPSETGVDYVTVEAFTKREAIVAGLREMRNNPSMEYWKNNYPGSPFRGLKAEEICEHELPIEESVFGGCSDCGGPGYCNEPIDPEDYCWLLKGHEDPHWTPGYDPIVSS